MALDARRRELLKHTFLDYRQTLDFIEHPLILERAEGVYYWDNAGRRYFDGIGGIFVACLGHRPPRVLEAMRRQMEKMTFAPPLHGISDVTLDFVEKLGAVAPAGLSFVKPFSGGSESVESAMKFARQYFKQTGHPGKYKFISRYHGYHGSTFGAMAASGTGRRKAKFEPQMGGFLKVFPPTHYRDQFPTWAECNRFCARMIEDVIRMESPDTVAGVILEPIGNTGGIITPTKEYYEIIRDACTRHNVLLIFDEVITGFGRTGRMFAAQSYGVTPDIICSGKGLGSGCIPLGAMIAREDLGEAFLGAEHEGLEFAHGNTFAGNPLACAAGIASINQLVEEKLPEQAVKKGAFVRRRLEGLKKHGVVREVRGMGLLLGVELVEDARTMRPFPEGRKLGLALKKTALQNGLILRADPDWFAVAPALTATESQLDELCGLIEKSFVEALGFVSDGKSRARRKSR